jgi:AcrR family transcriptional regulator
VPRIADHDARRAAIVEGLWGVIRESGIDAVSVRSVAAKTGISPTALRYYFAAQDELLETAMRGVVDRVAARIRPLLQAPRSRDGVQALLTELLPLDRTRREEQEIYLAFVVRAQTSASLRCVRDDTEHQLRQVIDSAVDTLARTGHLGTGRDPNAEAERLFALIDGMAFQAVLWPERHPPVQLRQILREHLTELGAPRRP